MRFISCHIENFGKLQNYSVDFTEGINNICEENGWGKSTFAAFVKAMFYGLEGERKRNIEENERKRYKPWQGGVFGGQIVFEVNGKRYKLSRIFGDKEVNDEFELRDAKTNLISNDFSKKIGEEIFKINQESFVRTIYIGQSKCETVTTDDINAKIGNLTDNTNDLNNFEVAYSRLTDMINKLNPKRISGSIAKRKEEIAKYDRLVTNGKEIVTSIETYRGYLQSEMDTYDKIKKDFKEASEQHTKVSKLQSVLAKKSEWDRLKNNVNDKKEIVETYKKKFPGNIPGQDLLKKKISECKDLEKTAERMSMYELSDNEKKESTELEFFFTEEVPDVSIVDKMIENASRYRKAVQERNSNQMSSVEKARLEELEIYFANDQKTPAQMIAKWNERNTKKATLPSHKAALAALKASMDANKSQKTQSQGSFMMIASIVAIVIGLILMFAVSMVAGLALVGLGIVLFIVGKMAGKKPSEQVQPEMSPEYKRLEENIDADAVFIEKVDKEVVRYLENHGKQFEEFEVAAVLQEIAAEAVEYSTLKKKALILAENIKSTDLENLRNAIVSFLDKYGVKIEEDKFSDILYEIKNKVGRCNFLNDKKENFKREEEQHRLRKAVLSEFLSQYHYKPAENLSLQLENIRELVDDYENVVERLKEAEDELTKFEHETDICSIAQIHTEENYPSLEELNQVILQLTEELEKTNETILDYNKVLDDLQEQYDEWEESRIKLEELKEVQCMEQKKYEYVFMARLKLSLAKEAMTSKYVDPILEGFCKYFKLITGNSMENFYMDANSNVTVDEYGKQRAVNTLSSGYRDLVGICLRIALVDIMYQNEKPVLVLDDPFISLDDKKIYACKEFIEKIAEKYQIIYFTCSSSRHWN